MMEIGQLSENFWRSEFACPDGCGFNTVDAELIVVLEHLRLVLRNHPITITSGCRCQQHNHDVGGADGSEHMNGKAADIVVVGIHADQVADCLEDLYPDRYGIGRYDGRTHIDVRSSKARWDYR
jgi:uncharacterized protein YcbK (DUF882 family)